MQFKLLSFLFLSLVFCSSKVNAQEICMVTAEYSLGEDYIVIWEQPADISTLDSVIIYRKQGQESVFSRVGAVAVGLTIPTKFTDVNATTTDTTKYSIAFKNNLNVEGPKSLWHQPVVYDYSGQGNGLWVWTAYKKENQLDESYITEYRCMMDQTGTGSFSSMGSISNTQNSWVDANWLNNETYTFVMETELPSCSYIEKANINTSRSNIKQQISTAEAGINESYLKGVSFDIVSNPVSDNLTVLFNDELNNATIWVSAMNGKQFGKSQLTGNNYKMSVSELSQGIYFFNVEVNGVISTKRFIKK